jgi:hypothetical protein
VTLPTKEEGHPNPLCRGRSLPGTPPTMKYIGRVTLMDKTESTVRNMLTAIEAPLYDIGVLSDRGMLPGLDGISAAAVLDRLSLLKYRNVRGSHIYVRPSGEHRFTALDDLNEVSLAKLAADGFKPCAVVETSAGNFEAWLKHSIVLPKLIGTFVAQTWQLATMPIQARRTGGGSGDSQASPTANPSTARPMVSSLSCGSAATPGSNTPLPRHSSGRSPSSTRHESRSKNHHGYRVLFLPIGDRGYQAYLLSDSEPQPSTATGPPPLTSLSVLLLMQMA